MYSRRSVLTLAVVIAIALSAAGCASSARPSQHRSAGTIVLDAVVFAQRQQTALVHMSLSSSGLPNGATLGGSGTGQVNFDTGAMKATFVYSGEAQIAGLQLDELVVGGHLYMAPSQDGQGVSTFLPGKEWIENPGNLAGQTTGAASENPAGMLSALRAKGNKVVDLGPSVVDGTSVTEYSVTINPASVLAWLSKEQMPVSVIQAAKALLKRGSGHMEGVGERVVELAAPARHVASPAVINRPRRESHGDDGLQ